MKFYTIDKKYRYIGMGEAFYIGDQYGEWDDSALTWREEDINQDDRPRLVSNQIKVLTDKAISKIIRHKPSVMGTPMSNQEEDIQGSKVAEQLMHHMFTEQNINDIQERWVKSACVTGIGWLKVDYNPFLGDEIVQEDNKQLEDGSEVEVEKTTLYKGKIEYTLPKSINIIPDITYNQWKKNRYIIEIMFMDVSTVKANWPDKAKDIKDVSSGEYGESCTEKSVKKDVLRLWEIWFPPCNEFKSGGYAIGTEDIVLEVLTPYPKKHKKIPYIPLIYTSDESCLWGAGVPQDIIQLQVEYNKIKNTRLENQNYAAAIKFLNPLTSGFDGDLMTNEPGEVIDYEGTSVPGWSQPMDPSPELTASLAEIKEEMQDLSKVSSTSQGKPPEGMRSGIAIQYLIENDDLSFAPVIRSMNDGLQELCYLTLEEMKANYEDEDDRYYKVIGENKQYQLRKFKKTSLNGKYDVIIQSSNSNPLLKAYKMDTIMQLVQYQVLGQEDRPFLSESLEVGNLKGVYEDIQVDMLRAKKEIDKIMEGKPHEIMKYDDDEQHITVKTRYLKNEYDNLSTEQREALMVAIEAHEQQLAEKMPPPLPPEGQEIPPEAVMPMGGQI